jgi:hypothetical protein
MLQSKFLKESFDMLFHLFDAVSELQSILKQNEGIEKFFPSSKTYSDV